MNAVLQTRAPDMHPDEWAARIQLAAAYRIFDMLGWTEMIYNHITVRLPASVTNGEKPAEDRRARQQAGHAQPLAGEPRGLHRPRGDPRAPAAGPLRDAHAHHHRAGGRL